LTSTTRTTGPATSAHPINAAIEDKERGTAPAGRRPEASSQATVRSWSRVREWPIPLDVYVDPEVVREYREQEAGAARQRPGRPKRGIGC
jgi:hypothetical protein